jgi:hypothetical protein
MYRAVSSTIVCPRHEGVSQPAGLSSYMFRYERDNEQFGHNVSSKLGNRDIALSWS